MPKSRAGSITLRALIKAGLVARISILDVVSSSSAFLFSGPAGLSALCVPLFQVLESVISLGNAYVDYDLPFSRPNQRPAKRRKWGQVNTRSTSTLAAQQTTSQDSWKSWLSYLLLNHIHLCPTSFDRCNFFKVIFHSAQKEIYDSIISPFFLLARKKGNPFQHKDRTPGF